MDYNSTVCGVNSSLAIFLLQYGQTNKNSDTHTHSLTICNEIVSSTNINDIDECRLFFNFMLLSEKMKKKF